MADLRTELAVEILEAISGAILKTETRFRLGIYIGEIDLGYNPFRQRHEEDPIRLLSQVIAILNEGQEIAVMLDQEREESEVLMEQVVIEWGRVSELELKVQDLEEEIEDLQTELEDATE